MGPAEDLRDCYLLSLDDEDELLVPDSEDGLFSAAGLLSDAGLSSE
jgi:hypothetical protein